MKPEDDYAQGIDYHYHRAEQKGQGCFWGLYVFVVLSGGLLVILAVCGII